MKVSDQERRIDGIISACLDMQNCVSEIDYRLSFYSLMEKVIVVTEEIECYIKRSKTELLTEIDSRFSYAKKAKQLENLDNNLNNPRCLMLKLKDRKTEYNENKDFYSTEYLKDTSKRYIPYNEDKNMEIINEEDFIAVYEKASKKNLMTPLHMQIFLRKALSGLIDKMNELDQILLTGNKALYPSLYEKYFGESILNYTIGAERPKFEHWRENHDATEEDDKWKKKIVDHVYVCIEELIDSEFLLYYENTLTEEDKEKFREEFLKHKIFKSKDCVFFLNLCDLVEIKIDLKGISLKPSEKKIGRYLYQRRGLIDSEGIEAFKIFLANMYLHQEALSSKPKKKKLDYDVVKFQFKTLLFDRRIKDFVAECYNDNYFDQFVDELMKSEFRDQLASGWEKPKSREKMKGHLIGALLRAGILVGKASEIARKYIGKKGKEADNFADYISEGKKKSKCSYSDWVDEYVNG